MLSHIVAVDSRGGIARGDTIPWDLPEDRARLWERVEELAGDAGVILISESTRAQIPRISLPRYTYSWTRKQGMTITNGETVSDIDNFLKNVGRNIVCLGGGELYRKTLPRASLIDMTLIYEDFGCEVTYPAFKYGLAGAENLPDFTHEGFSKPGFLGSRVEKGLSIAQLIFRRAG